MGYRFGEGEKSVCIVGSMRGNEIQQLYVCSQLIRRLKLLEQAGALTPDREILVVPSVNTYSMNIGKRFWTMDNTDVNRMFPGYDKGETTQRLAAKVFEQVRGYSYGIQLSSFYIQGDFMPHVQMMDTGYQLPYTAKLFGLPYVVIREPQPFDTTTLNYNWQLWRTTAFSIYMNEISSINETTERQADDAVDAVLRFLARKGILRVSVPVTEQQSVEIIHERDLITLKCARAGFYRQIRKLGDYVRQGDVLANILHPYEGEVVSQIIAPAEGRIFFSHTDNLANSSTVAFKLIV